ncbi:hypothetical protein CL622_05600 [archaeon]|nr:hypothetical protein [archaeon]|tara:strand:+ start:669 stop:1049 length:381 start_codon:yes stop_codon:yes gene_type:complete
MDYIEGLEFTDRNKLYERIRELESELKKKDSKILEISSKFMAKLERHRNDKYKAVSRLKEITNTEFFKAKDTRVRKAMVLLDLRLKGKLDLTIDQIATACDLTRQCIYVRERRMIKDAKSKNSYLG